jgi:hypothetical protein
MKFLKFILSVVITLNANAAFVPKETAKAVAQQFLSEKGLFVLSENIHLHKEQGRNHQNSLYIFNVSGNHQNTFVIVAADDIAYPILGYSLTDTFSFQNAPDHVLAWLADYEKRIFWGIENNIATSEEIKNSWDQLTRNKNLILKRRGSVTPIIQAKWNQSPYYNDLCPLDGNKRSVVGCVATAMAQVIRHWQYPTQGSGFYSYSHSTLGTISANFGNTTYNYSNMPNSISSKNNDVALLNFHCGVAVEMNYSAQSSGAYVISQASPVTNCAEYALKKYFSYPSTVNGQLRDNYSTSSWKTKVNNELDNARPIIYAGFGNGGGHAFIFDGYDNAGKYHINWGWGGAYNGYFEIDALNPDGLGTGGGTGSYNSGHQAIFGIEAPDKSVTDAALSMYAKMTLSASRISYGQPFSVTTNAANVSGKDFSGNLAVAVFDDSFNFVEFIGEMSNVSLQNNYAFNSLKFEATSVLAMLPGKYHLYLCYKNNGGDWKIANDYSTYTNYAALEVYYYSDMELYKDLTVTSGKIKKGETATVSFNVVNTGTTTFKGTYVVALFNMDGTFAQLIGSTAENNGLLVNNYYTNNLSITSPVIDVEPGTYLLAVQYQRTGSTNWSLMGSYFKVNPIKVIVENAPIQADPYETNNEVNTAYKINITYSNNAASWNSNISNIHTESDVDFYRIDFEKEYQYTVDVKVSDLNKNFNGVNYTLDARFSLSDDGVFWSSAFANELPQPLNVHGKDKEYLLVRVVPAFAGLKGNYDLYLNIKRESTAAVKNIQNSIYVYPNPAQNLVTIKSSMNLENVPFEIHSLNGALCTKGRLTATNQFDIKNLNQGMYILKLETALGIHTMQFIKE